MLATSVVWKSITSLTILLLIIDSYLLNFMAVISQNSHAFCLHHLPATEYYNHYAAMICGAKLPASLFTENLKQVGLYHLLVISGSHLIFIEQIVSLLSHSQKNSRSIILYIFVTALTFASLLSPPVFKAWISFMLRKTSSETRLFWTSAMLALISGVLCLLIFPNWLSSSSLQLSWAASILISWPMNSKLKKCFIIYLGLTPLLWGFQILNPTTALVNWFMAPIVGLILFPACLASSVFKPLSLVTDFLWLQFHLMIEFLAPYSPILSGETINTHNLNWFYIFILQVGLFYLDLKMKRTRVLS